MAARTKARTRAVDVLYEADQRALAGWDIELRELLAQRLQHTAAQTALPQYSVEIVEGVADHATEIDELITTYAQEWTLPRMPAVDRAILRLGVWELMFNDDVPGAVAVDEAVALATKLSTDDSPRFVNGLLGRILQLEAGGR
ncbi:transcription antitermination factor NusB [Georgenia satyanarayanai]|uniref:Transcription antitermination protein NusB n=1 Tax=Oceanitalea stevensii TaxID=2763072 RepID=A0ABR8YYW6_9MICO|nr:MULTISPECIES: transcription antitermination factor NusB [Georgenia]MBD8061268.1 transcription antitermination factor NusB [Oceanitalea stevensii]MCM3660060.1 transcription antitermination factor NusB [Georgenia satyanarayanai]